MIVVRCKYCGYESAQDFTFCPQCAYPAMECDRCLNGLCVDRPPVPQPKEQKEHKED